jgi:glucosamine-6-phosphate deaminase
MAEATVELFVQHFPSARTIALPTGRTFVPEAYGAIAALCNDGLISFEGKIVFLLDEFYPIDPHDERSNGAYMHQHLFSQIPAQPKRIFVPAAPDADSASRTIEAYDAALEEYGPVDLLMAGIGANGHVANNEPGSAPDSTTRIVDLTPETIAASNAPANRAITMGLGTILTARVILAAASGADKADALCKALKGPVTDAVPASHLQHFQGTLHLVIDEAAARLLR